jgi:ubiquinone/menaquinone biosynthesis C-methylase UbiE
MEFMVFHHQIIKKEFEKQAKSFSKQGLNQSNSKYIDWILKDIPLKKEFNVLDVAAGTAIMSRAIAPFVSRVVAIDISKDMLEQGRIQTKSVNLKNIDFVEGAVEDLPFDDNSFDLVISRFAFHHFVQPEIVISEMKRVCKKNGLVVIVDITPNDAVLSENYNYYERLRDPSHTEALTSQDFINLFNKLNIICDSIDTSRVEVNLNNWLSLTNTDYAVRNKIKTDLLNDINEKLETGLRPYLKDEELMFYHTYIKIKGKVL